MWGWLTALIKGIIGPLLQWAQTYQQGRNAEQAKSSQEAAAQAAAVSDAQSRVRDIVIDDDWMHRSSAPGEAPSVHGPGEPPGPRG